MTSDPEDPHLFAPGPPDAELELGFGVPSLSGWPPPVTGGLGRRGFRYEDVPAVFGRRSGVGPLIVNPDTNLLISLHENLGFVEDHVAALGGPYLEGPWVTTIDALRDLLGLWWWRDVRFRVDSHVILTDNDPARLPTPARAAARRRSVEAWSSDFWARGSFEVILEDDGRSVVSLPQLAASPNGEPRWPKGDLDRRVAQSALAAGCHVLLTEDKDVLRCHRTMLPRGMAVMRPGELLEALDEAGELRPVRTVDDPMVDLQALATFYALRSPEDALREEVDRQ